MIAPLDEAITQQVDDEWLTEEDSAEALNLVRLEREQFARELLRRDVQEIAADVFRHRPRISPLEWGEVNYELPESSAIKGLFRSDEMPFLKPIFDALYNKRIRRVTVAKGSQMAVTTVAQIWKGWTMDHSPAAMLSIWPGEGLLKRFVLTRINPMLEQVASLKAIFSRSGLRESGDSIKHKEFPGGTLDFVNANSPNELRSIAAERIHLSEVDELSDDLKNQGDPLDLARRALRTYQHTSKEFLECTPTRWGASKVWHSLTLSSWHEWWVPCPHCGHEQVMRWAAEPENPEDDPAATLYQEQMAGLTPQQRHHEEAKRLRFTYEIDEDGAIVPGSTHYICVECACLIPQSSLREMNRAGRPIARYPNRVTHFGIHLPSWYSPLQSWDAIAESYEKGKVSLASRKVFVNTIAGLPYKEIIAQPEAHFLQGRAEDYVSAVPMGVHVLTAGVDVQEALIVVTVWGWGAGEESWLIEWKTIEGDPATPEPWFELGQFLSGSWVDDEDCPRFISAVCVDAGYMGPHVKNWCASWRSPTGLRAKHVIGKDGRTRPIIEEPPQDAKRKRRSKRPSHIVGDESVKSVLYARMRLQRPGPEYIHTPKGLDRTFYMQLTAEVEQSMRNKKTGKVERKWITPAGRSNDALDATKYAYAALHTLPKVVQQLAKLAMLPPEKRGRSRRRRRSPAPVEGTEKRAVPVSPAKPVGGMRRKKRGMISRGHE